MYMSDGWPVTLPLPLSGPFFLHKVNPLNNYSYNHQDTEYKAIYKQKLKQWRSQTGQVGRAQPGLLTALIEYLTVLLEYLNFCNLSGRAHQTFGRAWAPLN